MNDELFEKVEKGLEYCKTEDCSGCPYEDTSAPIGKFGTDELVACKPVLYDDALTLIRAQQERIRELEAGKQPKPPRIGISCDRIFYACDSCGKSLAVVINSEGLHSLVDAPKYCPECGQAVKWGE